MPTMPLDITYCTLLYSVHTLIQIPEQRVCCMNIRLDGTSTPLQKTLQVRQVITKIKYLTYMFKES